MRIHSAILAVALVVAFVGCGSSGGSGDATTVAKRSPAERSSAETTDSSPPQQPRYPVPEAAPGKEPLRKLVAKDLKVGGGRAANWGDEVTVRYVGVYYETGEIYSQHWNSNFDFKLDGEAVGPGWQKGIEGMKVGGRRELLIPSDLLFGDGDLAYVVALLKVGPGTAATSSYGQKGPFSAITVKRADKNPVFDPPDRPAPKRLLFRELEEGSGPAARPGDEVAFRYAGAMYVTGQVRYGGRALPYQLGSGGMGEAFEEGLEGMRAGGRRELIIPSHRLGGSGAVDYVIELTRLDPASAEQQEEQ